MKMPPLEICKTRFGRYYITLNGECIHGCIYDEEVARSYLNGYQKIFNAGQLYQLNKTNALLKELQEKINV